MEWLNAKDFNELKAFLIASPRECAAAVVGCFYPIPPDQLPTAYPAVVDGNFCLGLNEGDEVLIQFDTL